MDSAYLHERYFERSEEGCGDVPTGVDILSSCNETEKNFSGDSLIKMRAQWAEELKQVEDEIQTLRQVLVSKFRRQQFLKRQLGITPIGELKSEVKQGLDTLRTSDAYLKTSAVVKTAKDKTSAVLFEKWNLLRQSNAYKSLESKVGSACSNVYGKLTRSTTFSGDNEAARNIQATSTNLLNESNPIGDNNDILLSMNSSFHSDYKNNGDTKVIGLQDDQDCTQLDNLFDEEVEMLSERDDRKN